MPDFADAEARHWEDAELLLGQSRWANADHLYGLAAECGLKAVLLACGVAPEAQTGAPDGHKLHINRLWTKFLSTAQGLQQGAYATILPSSNPFQNWLVDHRYEPKSRFSEVSVTDLRDGARAVRVLMAQARLDGFLPCP